VNQPQDDLVLWSDDSLLIVDKPAGLLAIRGGFDDSPYLTGLLEPTFGRVWVVHRLDRQTSGVLVLARTAAAHRALNTQFQEHTVRKTYHALTNGSPSWETHTVSLALRKDGDRRHRTVIDSARGKPSVTHLRVLERFAAHTLLEAIPETGRTHQIRAHLAAIGLPIVGDALYHGGQALRLADVAPDAKETERCQEILIARVALHALRLQIAHPITGDPLVFEAPYPTDLAVTLRHLGAQG